jgi:hypothetical protein
MQMKEGPFLVVMALTVDDNNDYISVATLHIIATDKPALYRKCPPLCEILLIVSNNTI